MEDASSQKRGRPAGDAPETSPIILLADDQGAVRKVTERILRSLGFSVLVARDGREAVEMFRAEQKRIRCVLLDVAMPVLDGVAACCEIRCLDPTVPVVLASGHDSRELKGRFPPGEQVHFVQKPFRFAELARLLQACVQGRQPP